MLSVDRFLTWNNRDLRLITMIEQSVTGGDVEVKKYNIQG